jgi:hypothetical protein
MSEEQNSGLKRPRPAHLWTFRGGAISLTEPDIGAGPGLTDATISTISLRSANHVSLDGTQGANVGFGGTVASFGSSDFTVTFWMKTNNTAQTGCKLGNTDNPIQGAYFYVYMGGVFPPSMSVKIDDGTNYMALERSYTLGWNCYAFVRQAATLRSYINGADKREVVSAGGTTNITTGNPLILGYGYGGNLPAVRADFTDIAIYSKALSDSEIAEQFNTENNPAIHRD